MTDIILNIAFGAFMACFTHELGHWTVGKAVGLKTSFGIKWRTFECIKYPQPCVYYEARSEEQGITISQRRYFGIAGFATEALAGVFYIALLGTVGAVIDKAFLLAYWVIFTIHLASYPFRMAGREENDFRWLT